MSSKVALDLKQFKHVSTKDNKTILKHKDGHWLHLDHSAMGKDHKAQLEALCGGGSVKMADGGQVPDQEPFDPANPQKNWDDLTKDQQQQVISNITNNKDLFQRAFQLAAGSMGPEAAEEGEMTQMPAEGMGKPARGVGQGITIKDGGPTTNPNVTAVIDGKPIQGTRIPAYADGGDVDKFDPNSLYSTDPQQAAPVLEQRYQEGTENAINSRAKILMAQQQMDNDKYGGDPLADQKPQMTSDEAELQAAHDVDTSQSEAAQARQAQEQDQQATAAKQAQVKQQILQQKAKMGLANEGPAPAPVQDYKQAAADQGQPQQPQQQGQGGGGIPDYGSLMGQAYSMGNRGIEDQAKAEAALGQAQAGVLEKQQENDTAIQAHYQSTIKDLDSERQAHIADIQNGYVNPDKYWSGYKLPNGQQVDGHSKVAAAIGMLIAGFNPTSRPNAATELLQHQMDQSLEAQKTNLQSDHNLLRANLDQFRNVKDATDMTRVMMNDAMQHKLELEAAKAKTPMAQAALYQAKAKLAQDIAPLAMTMSLRQTVGRINNDPNLPPGALSQAVSQVRMLNPEMGKDLQERLVPNADGNGKERLASIPVPAGVRSEIVAKQNLQDKSAKLYQWSKANSGTLSPSKMAEGRVLAADLQNAYREGINGGVFKKGEQEFIDNIVDSHPDKFFAGIRVLPKLEGVMKSNEGSLNTLKAGYGLPATHSAAQQTPVKGKDGRMYIFDARSRHYIPVQQGQ